jgi:hypothetical protein
MTLLEQLVAPVAPKTPISPPLQIARPVAARVETATRRRGGRKRRTQKERLAESKKIADEIAARMAAFARSLEQPYQTELLGHAVTLPPGVEPVQEQEGQ